MISRSARLLARSVRAAGYDVVAIDGFGDADTLAASNAHRPLSFTNHDAIDPKPLYNVLDEIEHAYGRMPIAWGSGWERSAYLLKALSTNWRIIGSSPEALFALSQPEKLNRLIELASVTSGVRSVMPASISFKSTAGRQTLSKSRYHSGGHSVHRIVGRCYAESSRFFQQYIRGRSYSANFLVLDAKRSDTRSEQQKVCLLGCSQHFELQPDQKYPYRQGAAVSSRIAENLANDLTVVAGNLAESLNMHGLFGIDFILNEQSLFIVDVNPRPTGTIGLHLSETDIGKYHIQAPATVDMIATRDNYHACGVLYAETPVAVTPALSWPEWVSDRPVINQQISIGYPVCTIVSSGSSGAEATTHLRHRYQQVRKLLARHVVVA